MDKGRCDPLGAMDSSASVANDNSEPIHQCSLTNAGYLQNAIATSAEFPGTICFHFLLVSHLIASFTTAIVVDRFGRKSLLTYCYTVASIFVILCNFCYSSMYFSLSLPFEILTFRLCSIYCGVLSASSYFW
jgi:hypothetical protein